VTFDYGIPAELFMGKRKGGPRQLRYRRFATAAEAIRFAVEELPAVRRRTPLQWVIVALVKALNVVAIEALVTDLHKRGSRVRRRMETRLEERIGFAVIKTDPLPARN